MGYYMIWLHHIWASICKHNVLFFFHRRHSFITDRPHIVWKICYIYLNSASLMVWPEIKYKKRKNMSIGLECHHFFVRIYFVFSKDEEKKQLKYTWKELLLNKTNDQFLFGWKKRRQSIQTIMVPPRTHIQILLICECELSSIGN